VSVDKHGKSRAVEKKSALFEVRISFNEIAIASSEYGVKGAILNKVNTNTGICITAMGIWISLPAVAPDGKIIVAVDEDWS
jgi:hypothetical protein